MYINLAHYSLDTSRERLQEILKNHICDYIVSIMQVDENIKLYDNPTLLQCLVYFSDKFDKEYNYNYLKRNYSLNDRLSQYIQNNIFFLSDREEIEKFFNDNFIDFSYYDCIELYYHFIADEIIALLNYYQQFHILIELERIKENEN